MVNFWQKIIVSAVSLVGFATVVASSTILDELVAAPASKAESTYTIYDDLTWAVVSPNLTHADNQIVYNDFMRKCRLSTARPNLDDESNAERADRLCDDAEENRLFMNQYQPRSVRFSKTWLYTTHRNLARTNFALCPFFRLRC
jgi:hypothetical protein